MMITIIVCYLLFSLPFAARVAYLSEWPCWSDGVAREIVAGVTLLLFGPFFWITWARSGQP